MFQSNILFSLGVLLPKQILFDHGATNGMVEVLVLFEGLGCELGVDAREVAVPGVSY